MCLLLAHPPFISVKYQEPSEYKKKEESAERGWGRSVGTLLMLKGVPLGSVLLEACDPACWVRVLSGKGVEVCIMGHMYGCNFVL